MTNQPLYGVQSSFETIKKTYNSYPDFDVSGVSFKGFYKTMQGSDWELRPQVPKIKQYLLDSTHSVYDEKLSNAFVVCGLRYDYRSLSVSAGATIQVIDKNGNVIWTIVLSALSGSNVSTQWFALPLPMKTNGLFVDATWVITGGSFTISLIGWEEL